MTSRHVFVEYSKFAPRHVSVEGGRSSSSRLTHCCIHFWIVSISDDCVRNFGE